MFEKNESLKVRHIIFEPGDATRYDLLVAKNGDDYIFAPMRSTFKLPQKINLYDIPDNISTESEEVIDIAEFYGCNRHTVVACMKIAMAI